MSWEKRHTVRHPVQWRRQGVAKRGLCPICKPLCPGCAPAGKPSSFHSVMQQQFFAFHYTIFHPTEANFLVLTAPEGRILKENYHKFSLGAYPITQFTHPPKHMAFACAQDSSTPLLGPRPSYSHRSYSAPLVPQQEQTPGAATNPVGSAQELGTIYALFAANLNSLHSRRNDISLQSHSFKTFVTHLPVFTTSSHPRATLLFYPG